MDHQVIRIIPNFISPIQPFQEEGVGDPTYSLYRIGVRLEIDFCGDAVSFIRSWPSLMRSAECGMRPPAQAPPQRGFCPGGRALWLGEIGEMIAFSLK